MQEEAQCKAEAGKRQSLLLDCSAVMNQASIRPIMTFLDHDILFTDTKYNRSHIDDLATLVLEANSLGIVHSASLRLLPCNSGILDNTDREGPSLNCTCQHHVGI